VPIVVNTITAVMVLRNVAIPWPSPDCHGLVQKKVAGKSTTMDADTRDLFLEKLPLLLEGYEGQDICSINEVGPFYLCFPGRILTLKGQSCHRVKSVKQGITVLLCV
jgi:hypothetical protein